MKTDTPSLRPQPSRTETRAKAGSFWQRRIVDPIALQLTQGITPEKIALTIAVGVAAGLLPLPGFTTLLCFLVAVILRLNQPIIHIINQVLWPVHLMMVLVYIRAGERMYGAMPMPYDPAEISRLFLHSQPEFWTRFGAMGMHALTAWLVTVPFIVIALFFPLRPILRRLARISPTDRFLP